MTPALGSFSGSTFTSGTSHGGEVTVLFEPLCTVPAVAIFGMGHVGCELARILARHDIELHLVDSRAQHADPERLAVLTADAEARVHTHHAVVPELALDARQALGQHTLAVLTRLIEDEAERVRASIADAVKAMPRGRDPSGVAVLHRLTEKMRLLRCGNACTTRCQAKSNHSRP